MQDWKIMHPGPLMDGYEKRDGEYPPIIQLIIHKLKTHNIISEDPFQVNINLYTPPNYCIVPHKDTLGKQVVIISLLSHVVLDFYKSEHPVYAAHLFNYDLGSPSSSIVLEPCSLLLLSEDAFF